MHKIYWLIGLILCLHQPLWGQQYNFKHFSFDEGLTELNLSDICEDQYGNLWIGTLGGGLFKYDGFSFSSFLKEDGLSHNSIHSTLADSKGNLWIGTSNGLSLFDGVRFHHKPEFDQVQDKIIKDIAEDKNSKAIWLATEKSGLYMMANNQIKQFTSRAGLPSNRINSLYMGKNGLLWVGTSSGLASFDGKKFKQYTNGPSSNPIKAIAEDEKENIWIATDRGISRFDDQSFRNYGVSDGLLSNKVQALWGDDRGNIWVGTANGLCKYYKGRFTSYRENISQASNEVSCIFKDRTGSLWFGTSGRGLSKLDSERFLHYPENDKLGKSVYALAQIANGSMVMGTSKGGLSVFDGSKYSFSSVTSGYRAATVQSLFFDVEENLWIGTQDQGLYKFDGNYQQYSTTEGLASNYVKSIAQDANGNTWIASADSGLSVLQNINDTLDLISNYWEADGLSSNHLSVISTDQQGNIWVGTENAGLNKITIQQTLDSLSLTFEHFTQDQGLSNNAIKCLLQGPLNDLYIGTAGGGINIFDGNEFRSISKADGLASNNIYALVFDANFNLWAGTERGVNKIILNEDFSVKGISNYGIKDGFKGIEVYQNAAFKDDEGNVWFGTVNGLIKYNPQEDEQASAIPNVQLTGLKLFFDDIENTPYADLNSSRYPFPDKLTLDYDQNNLSFHYIGVNLKNPIATRYKWMLQGLNKEWSPPLPQREATFSNLSPGTYTFKVMAGNEQGEWNEDPATYKFQILQPFWKAPWIMPTAIILIISLVSWWIYQQFNRIKTRNRIERERLEMEKSIIELDQEASRLQMNPHFIFNSLNSIQGFISGNEPLQAKRYLTKFARLMRLILENAREEFIPLENEITILERYMELEQLNSNDKFEFSIKVGESIDPETTEIPPMMIQPFVENAIIHGIKPKKGKGKIDLEFSAHRDMLLCKITDNGVGRTAKQNKPAKSNHKSTAMRVTRQRLEQLEIQTGKPAGFKIVDLKAGGEPSGTRVVVTMPYEAY